MAGFKGNGVFKICNICVASIILEWIGSMSREEAMKMKTLPSLFHHHPSSTSTPSSLPLLYKSFSAHVISYLSLLFQSLPVPCSFHPPTFAHFSLQFLYYIPTLYATAGQCPAELLIDKPVDSCHRKVSYGQRGKHKLVVTRPTPLSVHTSGPAPRGAPPVRTPPRGSSAAPLILESCV